MLEESIRMGDNRDWQKTACILCECNCGIEVQLGGEGGRHLTRIHGDQAHPASLGYACEKPSRLDYYQNGSHRLTRPLRRRSDGSFEEIDWETAIREVAERLETLRENHGGESIFYYGGGGQGNHLPGAYSRSLRAALGSRYRSNALAQEKTGEAWVNARMLGGVTRSAFEHWEVGVFIAKNPWSSHGIPRARVTLREIAKDPERCLIVIDPRRSETADLADIHLAVKPGTDAWLLAAMLAVMVQEDLVDQVFVSQRISEILPHFRALPVANYSEVAGVPEIQVREASRRIAQAEGAAIFEDLSVQMNRHSTWVSYLDRLLGLLSGNFGKPGAAYIPAPLQSLFSASAGSERRSPVTDSLISSGLVPCNLLPDELLSDPPKRFRAMWVDAAKPVHSLADAPRMREALEAMGGMPEDAVAESRAAWGESRGRFRESFFRMMAESPDLFSMAPVVLYRDIGDQLPQDLAEGAVLWALAHFAAQRDAEAIQRAGIGGEGMELGEALFDAILAGEDGDAARLTARRGSAEVQVEVSERMQIGHVSLPNGLGLGVPGDAEVAGVSSNELTASEDRDWLAGTPWHKYTPARLEAL